MAIIYQALQYLHILVGAAALVLFWVPMAATKGSSTHKRLGTLYANAMYIVSVSGVVMCIMVLLAPMTFKPQLAELSGEQLIMTIARLRVFETFLLALSLLVFVSIQHGLLVLKAKQNRELLKTPWHLVSVMSLTLSGFVVLYFGLQQSHTLYMIFGVLCSVSGVSTFHYIFKASIKEREWVIEHLSALVGSGIAVYTAFFAVGGRHLLSELLPGQWQVLPWVLPGVIGGVMISRYKKTVNKQFKVQ
ncbi:hypothetical protein C1E24_06765 [Pseudoalteromonas phenolica]|uniref:DUF2306 domain-containing protein n=1 Tax=Pseudoalteromonas phenolica TaxID=161398 RepID=A0A5R9Q5M4_9GAMM|nr:hypothetical protein [Pseudoalteromonas phenolica]TLX47932.1 hypothetical protein C1E24_06765 [Pseudoalteromonas phenolica]